MGLDELFSEKIPRRKFLKRTILGGAVLAGTPIVSSLLSSTQLHAEEPSLSELFSRDELSQVLREALSRGGDFADVYIERLFATTIVFSEGKVESVKYGLDQGVGIRVLKGDQTGYAYCEEFDMTLLRKAARTAGEIADGPARDEVAKLSVRSSVNHVPYALSVLDVSEKEKVDIVERADNAARSVDPRITQVKHTYDDSLKNFVLANSEGVFVADELPMVWLSIDTVATENGKKRPGYIRMSGRSGFEFFRENTPEDAGRKAAQQALTMLESKPAPMGEMPVVLAAGGGVIFHEAVGHGLEADGIKRKTSMFTGMVGEKVGSEHVTVIDDGTIANLRGSFNFDDEGVPAKRNVLIENGVLKGYMNDLLTAKHLKVDPTGNGRRQSYRHYPLVRMSNTLLAPGTMEPREVVEATEKGIYAKELGGGEVDTASGNFTFGLREGYLIENGQIAAPILGATLIGNGPDVMKKIDMVANDMAYWPGTCGKGQWVPVTSGAPTLRISRITIGGRE